MLDVIMVAGFILLTAMMVGVTAWAGKVVDEGSESK